MSGPLVLVVIDGFGIAPAGPGNAVSLARTPALDALAAEGSATLLQASGLPVGLPDGQMGNSEVGHLNLGAGRRVPQMLVRIDEAVAAPGGLASVPAIAAAFSAASGATLHLVGLVGDGGVHASQRHLIALLEAAQAAGVERVVVHAITDGRDSRPDSALPAIRALEDRGATIGTVVGRYWAMDRDHRWDRTQRAYDAMVHGRGEVAARASEAVQRSYDAGTTDEFIEPWVIGDPGAGRIRPGDQVLVWNFRPDRARQITQALGDPAFDGFDRGPEPPMPGITTMTRLRSEWTYPVAFESEDVRQGLAETVSNAGRPQLHVATYDQAPEMSAMGIRDVVVGALGEGGRDFIVVNFANADMVGHTGVVQAAVQGIEAVDRCMADIRPAVAAAGGLLMVTADHGNSEHMIEPDGSPNTAHTTNPVPLWIDRPGLPLREGRLGDVAPTACALMGWDAPAAMTGHVLLDAN